MTIEDKRTVVTEYCGKVMCNECKLNRSNSGWCRTHYITDCDESALDEALKLIDYKEVDHKEVDNDPVNHPSHYTNGGMECIDEMIMIFGKQAVMNFCLCNVWKYRKRALHKNGQEDLDKADWYMNKYKELKEEMGDSPLRSIIKEGVTYGA